LPSGVHLGTGSRVVATEKLNTQGSIQITNNSTDVAINGRGFFQVSLPDGTTAYTRDGSFKLNAEGELVTSGGYRVQPAISIPEGAISVTIGTDGAVSVQLQGQAAPNQVGTLQLADFINPAGMQARGENLLLETAASGPPQAGTPGVNGLGSLQQGALEASNVNVVEELVSMIETQRAYEMNSKAISTTDKMLEYLTQRL
jgi:flagellar basal-body rod protein FlgG